MRDRPTDALVADVRMALRDFFVGDSPEQDYEHSRWREAHVVLAELARRADEHEIEERERADFEASQAKLLAELARRAEQAAFAETERDDFQQPVGIGQARLAVRATG